MTQTLHDLINAENHIAYATDAGRKMHAKLQAVVINGDNCHGDLELIRRIKSCGAAADFFGPNSRTEAPVAGYINNKFISRRIDRICINNKAKIIDILDYKTDVSRDAMRTKYIQQLWEYRALISKIYPGYTIRTYILWTHYWELEQVQ